MMVGVGGGRVPLSGGGGGGGADAERASGRTAHGSTSSTVIYTAILNNKNTIYTYNLPKTRSLSSLYLHN